MNEEQIINIANQADLIISGYAFSRNDNHTISILNLEPPNRAMQISQSGLFLATNMDKSEREAVMGLVRKNQEFLQECQHLVQIADQTVAIESGSSVAFLSMQDQYSTFEWRNHHITFMHDKKLMRYRGIKQWRNGCLVVQCEGSMRDVYEDTINISIILNSLFMNAHLYIPMICEFQIRH